MCRRVFLCLAVCVLTVVGLPAAASAADVAVDFNIENDWYPDGGEVGCDDVVGYRFTVGMRDIYVTDLGFWDMGQNGLNDPHPVGIYDIATQSLVVSATVPSGKEGTLNGFFRYVPVPRIKLMAGKQYVILGYRPVADAAFDFVAYDCAELIVAPFIRYDDQVALNGDPESPLDGLVFTVNPWPECFNAWFGPTFKADSGPGATTATVLDRHIFYNNSRWDGNDLLPNAADDAAIAVDKQSLLPGGTAAFANYTSYSRGINGIMIDIQNLKGIPTLNDFLFRMGNNNVPYGSDPLDPSGGWPWAPDPISITVQARAGVDGSDRVTLIWEDNAIAKCWLQVTVMATTVTGLVNNDVFYFGNAVGESGDSTTHALVNATDEIGARNNPHGPFTPAPLDDVYDFNRDKLVNATDQIIARNNRTSPFSALMLIKPQ